jgi:type I restriction enzyme S subunit
MQHWPISLPSLGYQQAIAAVLGAVDDKIVVNQNVASTSNGLMKALYERAISQGFIASSVGKIADVFDGPHATPEKTESGPWFLSISSLQGGRLVLGDSAHLSYADFRRWTRRVEPCPGDVLFSYETRLGEAALMPPDIQACLGRRMALLRSRDGTVGSRTILQAFLSKAFQDTIRQQTIHGATVDRISLTGLPSWPINLPTQETLQLEVTLSRLDDLAWNSECENERLSALRDALLPGLISGEIRVRDAERNVEGAT